MQQNIRFTATTPSKESETRVDRLAPGSTPGTIDLPGKGKLEVLRVNDKQYVCEHPLRPEWKVFAGLNGVRITPHQEYDYA